MTPSLPLPEGLPLDITSWEQTPLVVRPLVVHLLAVIQHEALRMAALDTRVSQLSTPAPPPVSPSSNPPSAKRTARLDTQGNPGAKT